MLHPHPHGSVAHAQLQCRTPPTTVSTQQIPRFAFPPSDSPVAGRPSSSRTAPQLRSSSTLRSQQAFKSSCQMNYMKPLNMFQEVMKSRGRLLGLDVGYKYVGLAVSDLENKIASPLSVLLRKKSNIDLMATDFQSLISKLSLEGFVFGYPFDRQKNSPTAVQVKLLIDDLSHTGKLDGVKYTFWDESFTSKSVEMLLKPLNLHPVQSKTILDKFAAVEILQGYLDFVNRSDRLQLQSGNANSSIRIDGGE